MDKFKPFWTSLKLYKCARFYLVHRSCSRQHLRSTAWPWGHCNRHDTSKIMKMRLPNRNHLLLIKWKSIKLLYNLYAKLRCLFYINNVNDKIQWGTPVELIISACLHRQKWYHLVGDMNLKLRSSRKKITIWKSDA